MTLFWINIETRNFSFDSFGATEELARESARKGWVEHVRQTGADADYIEEALEDANVREIHTGSCIRDGDIDLNKLPKPKGKAKSISGAGAG